MFPMNPGFRQEAAILPRWETGYCMGGLTCLGLGELAAIDSETQVEKIYKITECR
jgi:hypothetical protein